MALDTNEATVKIDAANAAALSQQSGPANIPAATQFSTSGAPVQIVPDVDPNHPAVDNNPRAGTSILQNRIDFNDPGKSAADAVADNLNAQGVDTVKAADVPKTPTPAPAKPAGSTGATGQ